MYIHVGPGASIQDLKYKLRLHLLEIYEKSFVREFFLKLFTRSYS